MPIEATIQAEIDYALKTRKLSKSGVASLRYSIKHKHLGLCHWCSSLVEDNKTYCTTCLIKKRECSKLRRIQFKLEGRCTVCGMQLIPEKDGTHSKCITCKGKNTDNKFLSRL